MSTTPEAFYLRLNNHQGFMTGALAELYSNQMMVDVTLSAEGQLIRAHKIILSACSPYFKNILLQNSTHYPVIIIKDMPFADLKAIVEFIYRGEITIPQQQLESILTNGALLQIKGLSEVNKKKCTDSDNEPIVYKDTDRMRRNACESNQIKENKTKKRTRKRSSKIRSSINSSVSNGENFANYGDISSLEDTNDALSGNEVDFHRNMKFIKEKFANNQMANKKGIYKLENITSLMANDNKVENPLTADIVPFNLLEQSMMIDVKQDVSINAGHDNHNDNEEDSSTGIIPVILSVGSKTIINNTNNFDNEDNDQNEEMKDEEKAQLNNENICNDIPMELMSGNTSTKSEQTSSSTAQQLKPTKLRVSKAGIPRKGTSIRSQKKYKCPVCHKIYVSPQNMKEHLRNMHTNPNHKYLCNICSKQYSWKHALDRHIKSKHI